MGKKYTKVEHLASFVEFRHNQGETYREIATSMGLSREQVREPMKRERRKQRTIATGYIRYAVVYAYLPTYPHPSPDEALPYTHTLLPDGIEKKPRRFAISYRNRWMVEHSDYVIAYVLYRGGAMQFVELAQQKGKTVLNLAT